MRIISIVLPLYNEKETLLQLYIRLIEVTKTLPSYSFEFIFVDDGSEDDSLSAIKKLRTQDPRVKLLSLSRNFGHQIALTAGMDHSVGDCVIVMDGDLQHPPELIPELIRKWEDGFEVVNTRRIGNGDCRRLKKITSKIFYWSINKISRFKIEPNSADFRLMDKKAVEGFRSLREKSRFIRGLVSWVGYKQISIRYSACARQAGNPGYSLSKMAVLAIDGMTSFSSFPLRFATVLGMAISLTSFAYGCYAIYEHLFTEHTVPGWTSIFVAVIFIGGCQLISIGILGEYVSRIFDEVKERPLYIVKEKLGIE